MPKYHWTDLKIYNLFTHQDISHKEEYDAFCDCKNSYRNPSLVLLPLDAVKGFSGFLDPQTDVDWSNFWDKGDEIISRHE